MLIKLANFFAGSNNLDTVLARLSGTPIACFIPASIAASRLIPSEVRNIFKHGIEQSLHNDFFGRRFW